VFLQPIVTASGPIGRGAGSYAHGGGLTWLALAYAKNRQPEEACHFGERALDFRLPFLQRGTLRRVSDELGGWAGDRCVRRFRSRLNEACLAPAGASET
jgi:hypothetical protein